MIKTVCLENVLRSLKKKKTLLKYTCMFLDDKLIINRSFSEQIEYKQYNLFCNINLSKAISGIRTLV